MNNIQQLLQEYHQVLSMQHIVEDVLDYARLDEHLPFLKQLDTIGNSAVSVFDLFKKEHVFVSSGFGTMLGYDLERVEQEGNSYFDSRVHPEDLELLLKHGIELLKFCFALPPDVRKDYKLVNDYRIKNGRGEYVRVLEQHQALELDPDGNLWLALSITDLSPETDLGQGIKSRLFNYKSGEVFHFPIPPDSLTDVKLSSREQEILQLIRSGLISKEIADQLYLSVHTVNTHRQRILGKLNVNNSLEAVRYASRLGLIE